MQKFCLIFWNGQGLKDENIKEIRVYIFNSIVINIILHKIIGFYLKF